MTPAGVDIGGTKCLGVILRDGEVVRSARRPTPVAAGLPDVIADLLEELDRKSTRLNSSHVSESRMPSSA